jgi:hypothetical protein
MQNHLDIQLLHEGMALPSGTGSPLSGGAGLCWLENEFFRYGSAVAMGNGRFRLLQLLRGCHASEGEMAGHQTGERFVLLENDSGRLVEDISLLPGMALSVEALGLGDVSPVAATRSVQGHAIRPPPPVHGQVAQQADGSVCVSWVRRTRIDAGWHDGVDQAIVEDIEQYHVSISGNGSALANRTVDTPVITLTAAELTIFDLPPSTALTVEIRQIGRFALSEKLALTAAIFS